MTRVLVLQNSPLEGPGLLGKLLEDDGFDIHTVDARHGKFPTDRFDVLVVLGGPVSVTEDLDYLRGEQSLMRTYIERDTPIIGICLGSQLLARTCGAQVYRGDHPEIGFYGNVVPNTSDALMYGLSVPFEVFHWHSDTFDLPKGAVRLAHSDSYENQAFRIGSAVGLQFHLELGPGMLNSWLDAKNPAIKGVPTIDIETMRRKATTRMSAVSTNMRKFYANFKTASSL